MEVAGAKPEADDIFSETGLAVICRYTGGLPRLRHTICESALITGYARQLRQITPEVIEHVAHEARLDVRLPAELPEKAPNDDHVLKQLFEMVRLLEKAGGGKEPAKFTKEDAGADA